MEEADEGFEGAFPGAGEGGFVEVADAALWFGGFAAGEGEAVAGGHLFEGGEEVGAGVLAGGEDGEALAEGVEAGFHGGLAVEEGFGLFEAFLEVAALLAEIGPFGEARLEGEVGEGQEEDREGGGEEAEFAGGELDHGVRSFVSFPAGGRVAVTPKGLTVPVAVVRVVTPSFWTSVKRPEASRFLMKA